VPLDGAAFGRAAADHAADAVFRHELEGAISGRATPEALEQARIGIQNGSERA
jgi:hypothetical protein